MERRLAAILVADMVGYSRLMEADEASTLARQKAHRAELVDPKIAGYNGRIVKLMGAPAARRHRAGISTSNRPKAVANSATGDVAGRMAFNRPAVP